ncbi:uncharacterized protein LTR77_002708 [Saxophila tyrrhenica]|uniref:Uncharacterized protein n=1 Tax=Saxophila tyrrhenica TaxID=1690608 RepID=A0AAV9PH29_9PEZI|nr:hypothetical protein LTR77_002708 [Saxophila tyrrhenica]
MNITSADFQSLLHIDWLANVRSLVVPERIGGQQELEFYGQLIRNQKWLISLEIRTEFMMLIENHNQAIRDQADRRDPPYYLHSLDDVTGPRFPGESVVERLSRPFATAAGSDAPVRVENLSIFVRLPCVDALRKMIDLKHIKHLTVVRCFNVGQLLDLMTSLYTGSASFTDSPYHSGDPSNFAMRSFRYYATDRASCTSPSMEAFLASFGGLELLLLEVEHWYELDLNVLERHLDTLVHLYIGLGFDCKNGTGKWRAEPAALAAMLRRIPRLQQLALTFPRIDTFDNNPARRNALRGFLDAVAEISNLQILRMISWPLSKLEWWHDECQDEVDKFANTTVGLLAKMYGKKGKCSPLRLFIVGNANPYDRPMNHQVMVMSEFDKSPVCYKIVYNQSDTNGPGLPRAVLVSSYEEVLSVPVYDALLDNIVDVPPMDKGLGVGGFFPARWKDDNGYLGH